MSHFFTFGGQIDRCVTWVASRISIGFREGAASLSSCSLGPPWGDPHGRCAASLRGGKLAVAVATRFEEVAHTFSPAAAVLGYDPVGGAHPRRHRSPTFASVIATTVRTLLPCGGSDALAVGPAPLRSPNRRRAVGCMVGEGAVPPARARSGLCPPSSTRRARMPSAGRGGWS